MDIIIKKLKIENKKLDDLYDATLEWLISIKAKIIYKEKNQLIKATHLRYAMIRWGILRLSQRFPSISPLDTSKIFSLYFKKLSDHVVVQFIISTKLDNNDKSYLQKYWLSFIGDYLKFIKIKFKPYQYYTPEYYNLKYEYKQIYLIVNIIISLLISFIVFHDINNIYVPGLIIVFYSYFSSLYEYKDLIKIKEESKKILS